MKDNKEYEDIFVKYENILKKYSLNVKEEIENISEPIKIGIENFMSTHKKVAIYCRGYHTKMLMADFMFNLKDIKCIIDNYQDEEDEKGFKIIKESKISEEKIDGIILSTYKFREKIKKSLQRNYPSLDIFDLYDYLEERDVYLPCEYYRCGHPYNRYSNINQLQIKIREEKHDYEELYRDLISEYINIKDFRLAGKYSYELFHKSKKRMYKKLGDELEDLYALEIEEYKNISRNHIFMMCIDGLRSIDFKSQSMPKLTAVLMNKGCVFSNAYAYSTSTFESLIPVYSKNFDMRSNSYQENPLVSGNCHFIEEAKKKNRTIHFYTHTDKYIEDNNIDYDLTSRTVTQLLWRALSDIMKEENGFYYFHILYESHYSFSNPYSEDKLIPEGSAMLFDYMEKNGGCLRTDYVKLHTDAVKYIDDTLAPILDVLPCNFIIYADHGNIILDKNTKLKDVHRNYLSCHEDWLRIPLALSSTKIQPQINDELISLSSLNDMIIALMENKDYIYEPTNYIKFGRSELYNPNFRYLYKTLNEERKLLAFEGFIFAKGYKLVIYSDGYVELFDLADNIVDNKEKIVELLSIVNKDITVTDKYAKPEV